MNDAWKHQLERLAAAPADDDVETALRSVRGRSRRRKALTTVGVAAVATAVVGTAVLATRSPSRSGDDVATDAAAGDDRPGETTTSTSGGDAVVEPTGGGDAFPWTTSTTTPGTAPTADQIADIEAQLHAMDDDGVDPQLQGFGMGQRADGSPVYEIRLRADAVELADELWDRWGSLVEISLGERIYPTGEPTDDAGRGCPAPLDIPPAGHGLTGALVLDDGAQVVSGADIDGTVTVRNTTDEPISVLADSPSYVASPGQAEPVAGTSTTVTAAVAIPPTDVPPGGSAQLEVTFGTTDCGPDGPPGVAPGSYEAVAQIRDVTDGMPGRLLLVRAPLTVTPAG